MLEQCGDTNKEAKLQRSFTNFNPTRNQMKIDRSIIWVSVHLRKTPVQASHASTQINNGRNCNSKLNNYHFTNPTSLLGQKTSNERSDVGMSNWHHDDITGLLQACQNTAACWESIERNPTVHCDSWSVQHPETGSVWSSKVNMTNRWYCTVTTPVTDTPQRLNTQHFWATSSTRWTTSDKRW